MISSRSASASSLSSRRTVFPECRVDDLADAAGASTARIAACDLGPQIFDVAAVLLDQCLYVRSGVCVPVGSDAHVHVSTKLVGKRDVESVHPLFLLNSHNRVN